MSGCLVSFIDVTERNAAMDQVRQLQDEMAHVDRLSSMAEMATGIAHELSQPLTAIAGFADVCRHLLELPNGQQHGNGQVTDHVTKISELALESIAILARLREHARCRQLNREVTDVGELIESGLQMVAFDIRRRSVQVDWEPPENSVAVSVDPVQIRQVLVNLMINAIQAMQDTDPSLRQLRIRLLTEGSDLCVRMSDRGCGLPDGDPEGIFHPFVTTKQNGTGFGLAISRRIVESHSGVLNATSRPDFGAVFELRLPVDSPS